jgi:CBS domain containing-hemolysin-like protein
MLIAAARGVVSGIEPRSVVVAIVGGTMLTLALTRPRLRWVERLTEDSESHRLWAERALTLFALAMAGYAFAALFLVLHKQLGSEVDTMLRGAAYFLIAYAWLVHFEPFVAEWRLGGGLGTGVLYTGLAFLAIVVGVLIAKALLTPSLTSADLRLILISTAITVSSWLFYKFLPRFNSFTDSLLGENKDD